jgi:hypothetical protein
VSPAGNGADGNGNGTVDAGDLAVWIDQIGPPAAAEVLEAAAIDSELSTAAATADPDPAALADALFAAGDFTSLFQSTSDPMRPRGYRPPRRG